VKTSGFAAMLCGKPTAFRRKPFVYLSFTFRCPERLSLSAQPCLHSR